MKRHPYRFPIHATILTAVACLCGCMEIEHDLRIEENGSGTYLLKYAITETAVAQFRAVDTLTAELAEARGETEVSPPLHPILKAMLDPQDEDIRKLLKPYRSDGVTIKHLKIGVRNAWRQVEMTLAFEDLGKIENTDFFRMHGFELRKETDGSYVFWRRPHVNAEGALPPAIDPTTVKQLAPILNGFKAAVRVTVPGRILSSSALRSTLFTASWTFDFDTNPNALVALQQQPFRIAFEGAGLRLPEVSYAGTPATPPAE